MRLNRGSITITGDCEWRDLHARLSHVRLLRHFGRNCGGVCGSRQKQGIIPQLREGGKTLPCQDQDIGQEVERV